MKKIFILTLVAALTGIAASAEAHTSVGINLGFLFAPRPAYYSAPAPVYYPAPAYCPPPAPTYYAPPAYYAPSAYYVQPPYPCEVTPVGYDEVQVVYFNQGYRHSAYFPRGVWEREGWGAWRHEGGHRW